MADHPVRAGGWYRPYAAVLRSRIRAQRAYPLSFASDILAALLIGVSELATVWVLFRAAGPLGGLDLQAMLLLFGLSNVSFAVADMFVGHTDTLPTYIRLGTLDAFYLRPLPLLAQLMTSEIALRRVARIAVACTALATGLAVNDIAWDPAKAALLVLTLGCGAIIFSGLFICAAGLQFFLINGAELTSSFTYGGSYASQQPASLFPGPLKLVFGYAIPVVFTSYLPTLSLLGLPGTPMLPAWLAWFTPVAAAWVWILALVIWRWGTRHYQGGGG